MQRSRDFISGQIAALEKRYTPRERWDTLRALHDELDALPQPEPAPYCQTCGKTLDGYVPPEPAASWELVRQCEEALNACMSEMKKEFEHAGEEYEDEENQCDSDECLRCFIWNTCEPVIVEIAKAKGGK